MKEQLSSVSDLSGANVHLGGWCVSPQQGPGGDPLWGVSPVILGMLWESAQRVEEQWEQGLRQSRFLHCVHLYPEIPNSSIFTECRSWNDFRCSDTLSRGPTMQQVLLCFHRAVPVIHHVGCFQLCSHLMQMWSSASGNVWGRVCPTRPQPDLI